MSASISSCDSQDTGSPYTSHLNSTEIAARRVVQREFAAGQPFDGIGLGLGDVAISVDEALRLGRGECDGRVWHRYLRWRCVVTDEGHPHAGTPGGVGQDAPPERRGAARAGPVTARERSELAQWSGAATSDGQVVYITMIARAGRGQEDGQAVAPTGRLAASSVLAPATNSDQWPPVAKHTAAKRSRSALALAAFEVL